MAGMKVIKARDLDGDGNLDIGEDLDGDGNINCGEMILKLNPTVPIPCQFGAKKNYSMLRRLLNSESFIRHQMEIHS